MKRFLLTGILLLSLNLSVHAQAPDDFIASYAKAHQFNGTILIQKQGRVDYVHSFGMANLAFNTPNERQTRYKIASITKLFTSVLIMQLYEQGRIDLDKPFIQYLPDYKGKGGAQVTVHQLLNHTSGLPNFDQVTDASDAIHNGLPNYQRPYTSQQLLDKFCSGDLVHAPGKVFDYNNGDYVVLGKIIEHAYGEPYEQVLKERILQPLQLKKTGMLHQSDIVDGLADTYFYRDDLKTLANDLPAYPENWYAAGALYSTADDLLTFSNALFGGKLLKPATLDRLLKPGLDDYGYGLWSYEMPLKGRKHHVAKRPGRIMGAQTELFRVLDQDTTVIILSNTGTADLDEFVAEIARKVAD